MTSRAYRRYYNLSQIYLFLTVEVHLQDTQEILGAQLPYRRRERRMFVIYIYSSSHENCALLAIISEHSFGH